MEDLIQVVIMSDDDGHEFVIPADKQALFNDLLDQGEDDDWEAFNNAFGDYRAGGAIDIPLFAKVGYEADL